MMAPGLQPHKVVLNCTSTTHQWEDPGPGQRTGLMFLSGIGGFFPQSFGEANIELASLVFLFLTGCSH
jgi:hypothetical protein